MKIEGAVFYVTGCDKPDGIGRALVIRLLRGGARVLAVDISVAALEKDFAEEISKKTLEVCATDITNVEEYKNSFKAAFKAYGGIDACILNAGVYEPVSFWDDLDGASYLAMDVNASAAFKGTRLAIDAFLQQQKPGLIILTGSVAAQVGVVKTPIYCASKWAVEGFVRSLAFLDKEASIRVLCLEPGVIRTSFWDQIGIDKSTLSDEQVTPIPALVDAWVRMITQDETLPGGTVYECTAKGSRIYSLDSPRSASENKNRTAGGDAIVQKMRDRLAASAAS